jgi:hypothetical protein
MIKNTNGGVIDSFLFEWKSGWAWRYVIDRREYVSHGWFENRQDAIRDYIRSLCQVAEEIDSSPKNFRTVYSADKPDMATQTVP